MAFLNACPHCNDLTQEPETCPGCGARLLPAETELPLVQLRTVDELLVRILGGIPQPHPPR